MNVKCIVLIACFKLRLGGRPTRYINLMCSV